MSSTEFTRAPTLPIIVEAVRGEMGSNAIRRSFNSIGILSSVVNQPRPVLLMRDLFGLLELFARERGDSAFGLFAAGALRPDSFGLFVRYAMQAPNLGTAIERVVRGARLHQTCSTFSLRSVGGVTSWSYRVDLPLTLGRHHHAVHVLLQMVAFLAQFLGFRPGLLEFGLEAITYGANDSLEEIFDARGRWSQPTNYILIPSAHLLTRRSAGEPSDQPITFGDLLRYARDRPPRTAAERTEAALHLSLASGTVSIDSTARYLNIGVRTLQRQLAGEGVTYHGVLEQVQRRRAVELISEGTLPLGEISKVLGYSDAAHFTRAYRRWYGVPPSVDLRARVHQRRPVSMDVGEVEGLVVPG